VYQGGEAKIEVANKKVLDEAVINDQSSELEKADALIMYHLGIDPDTLSDDKWAAAFKALQWARQQERKHSQP
jgi:hypothetical protein